MRIEVKDDPLTVKVEAYVDTNEVYDLYYSTKLQQWVVSVIPNGKDVNELEPF